MELYTVVSLIIGIFGATYAVQSAIRTNFDWQFKDAKEKSDDMLEALISVESEHNLGVGHCKKFRNTIHRMYVWWTWAHIIPAVLFFLAISAITIWVLSSWDDVMAQHDSTYMTNAMANFPCSWLHSLVTILAILNAICLLTGLLVFWRCKVAEADLQKHHDHLRPAASNSVAGSQPALKLEPVRDPTAT